uniref:NAD-dependent epimerase/dehydratase family protein n=1 Tax=Thermofilum pendens TaxID=2269 RepID=A0A7J3X6K3_THEPE
MRVLVTGGAGFIGGHVALSLAERGYEVAVLDNLERPSPLLLARLREAGLPVLVGDVRSFYGCRGYDVVVHAAAYIDVAESVEKPVEYLENNAVATARVAKACAESGALVIYMSSAAVYGEPESLPLREDHPTRPISPYGLSKLVGEQVLQVFARTYGLRYVVLRLFNVYGPGQSSAYAGVVSKFAERAARGLPPIIYGDGLQTRDFVHVRDVARAVHLCMEQGASNEVFNIATGRPTTILELAKLVCRLAGVEAELIFEKPRPGDIRHSYADISKASSLLGYKPTVSLEEGLKELLDLYRSAQKLRE